MRKSRAQSDEFHAFYWISWLFFSGSIVEWMRPFGLQVKSAAEVMKWCFELGLGILTRITPPCRHP